MKLKMSQVLDTYKWIVSMKENNLPYATAFMIATNASNIEKEIKNFEEQKMSMLEKYGKKDSDGKLVIGEDNTVELINKEEFASEFAKLLECEVEVTINKIPMEAMNGMLIPIEQMVTVSFMFTAPELISE